MKTLAAIETALEEGDEGRLRELCESLHPADAAAAFTALDEEEQEQFGHYLDSEALSLIASYLPAPESADLVAGLPRAERTEAATHGSRR